MISGYYPCYFTFASIAWRTCGAIRIKYFIGFSLRTIEYAKSTMAVFEIGRPQISTLLLIKTVRLANVPWIE